MPRSVKTFLQPSVADASESRNFRYSSSGESDSDEDMTDSLNSEKRTKGASKSTGSEALEMVADVTQATCPKCFHDKAYYRQVQTRSADEPSSIFYMCCNSSCSHQWREG
jgi:DNA-directed RNA polymerase subunit M/transcription elongation factor TFIIS